MDDKGLEGDGREPEPGTGGKRLRIVGTGSAPAPGDSPRPPLRLLREFKGPTVAGVLRHVQENPNMLPGRLLTVARAVRAGELASADQSLTDALSTILPGPGYRSPSAWLRVVWPLFVLVLAGTVVATLIAFGVL